MKEVPTGMQPYKRTAVFTEASMPAALRARHNTKPGAWARIVVLSGRLRYRIESDPPEEWELTPERPGVIEESVYHAVEALGPVSFYLEFYKQPDTDAARLARPMDRELGFLEDGGD